MYTRPTYSIPQILRWTRIEIFIFLAIAAIPVAIYQILGQTWFHLPWLPLALVGTAVAFILSFQNNVAYDRLWEARKIWGGIVNTSRTWTVYVKDFITNDFAERAASEEELDGIRRELVMRHVAWLTALRHAMRTARPWELFLQHRANREWSDLIQVREHRMSLEEEIDGYLAPEEQARILAKTNKPAQLLANQSARLRELKTRGLLDDFRHMALAQTISTLFDLQGKSERIKNFPYPRQYATLNVLFVWIFVLLLPLGVVQEFEKIGRGLEGDYPVLGDYFVWLAVPLSTVVMWIFHTLGRIGRAGENPFEGTANDVPITTMSRGIEIDLREMLDESPETIPEPIAPKHDTQT